MLKAPSTRMSPSDSATKLVTCRLPGVALEIAGRPVQDQPPKLLGVGENSDFVEDRKRGELPLKR